MRQTVPMPRTWSFLISSQSITVTPVTRALKSFLIGVTWCHQSSISPVELQGKQHGSLINSLSPSLSLWSWQHRFQTLFQFLESWQIHSLHIRVAYLLWHWTLSIATTKPEEAVAPSQLLDELCTESERAASWFHISTFWPRKTPRQTSIAARYRSLVHLNSPALEPLQAAGHNLL